MNLPNLLTILRFLLIPVYLAVFAKGYMIPAFFIIVAAGVTDILDGYIARTRGQVTILGSMLDPLADKTLMIAVFVSLLVSGYIPWGVAIALFIRDLGMIIGSAIFHFRGKRTVPANWMGKLTTLLFYLAIVFIFFRVPYADSYLWFVVVFSFVTSIMYVFRFITLNGKSEAQ